jgi:hypothetical protein
MPRNYLHTSRITAANLFGKGLKRMSDLISMTINLRICYYSTRNINSPRHFFPTDINKCHGNKCCHRICGAEGVKTSEALVFMSVCTDMGAASAGVRFQNPRVHPKATRVMKSHCTLWNKIFQESPSKPFEFCT